MGLFKSCQHEWEKESKSSFFGKDRLYHVCTKCGKTENCDADSETSWHTRDCIYPACSKCGNVHLH
jgi:hypothetical protein